MIFGDISGKGHGKVNPKCDLYLGKWKVSMKIGHSINFYSELNSVSDDHLMGTLCRTTLSLLRLFTKEISYRHTA